MNVFSKFRHALDCLTIADRDHTVTFVLQTIEIV